jgi:hypothetical protein
MGKNKNEAFESALTSTQRKLQEFIDSLSTEEQAVMASITGMPRGEVEGFMVDTARSTSRTSHVAHKSTGEIGIGNALHVNTPFGQSAVFVDEKLFESILSEKVKFNF